MSLIRSWHLRSRPQYPDEQYEEDEEMSRYKYRSIIERFTVLLHVKRE